ncbi:Sec20 family protein [Zea mays]|uniref:Sec20 family protein n=1 Tax=Zea mays TaxID=4577 RepID=A0A1D6J7E8_MAIZE|nr:Sec20 family protein [Zea mays]AQK43848.1 Sec20 family protein [Zea mays]
MDGVTQAVENLPRLNGSAQDALQLLKSLQFQLDLLAQQLPTFDEVQSGQATLKSWDEQYKKTLLLGDGEESTIRRRNLQPLLSQTSDCVHCLSTFLMVTVGNHFLKIKGHIAPL